MKSSSQIRWLTGFAAEVGCCLVVVVAAPAASGQAGCAGSLDPTFNAGSGVWPPWGPTPFNAVTVQPDGKVIIAGGFESVQGAAYPGIARLNLDGSVDSSYVPNPSDAQPHTRVTQPDGKRIEIVQEDEAELVVRFQPDGSRDTNFHAALPHRFDPNALALRPDGKILVAGGIYSHDSETYTQQRVTQPVVRLNADGSLDPTFVAHLTLELLPPETSSEQRVAVYDMALDAEGRIYLGGFFTGCNGVRRTDLLRLTAHGSLDPTFEPDLVVNPGFDAGDVEVISALGLTPDGQLVVAGHFEALNGVYRYGLARLYTTAEGCNGIVSMTESIRYVREIDGSVEISVRRSGATNHPATVEVRTGAAGPVVSSSYAAAGEDFLAQSELVTFAPGETSKTLSVTLLDDALLEASQSFSVRLLYATNAANAAVLRSDATATTIVIFDDESAGLPGSVDESFHLAHPLGAVWAMAQCHDSSVLVAHALNDSIVSPVMGLVRLDAHGQLIAAYPIEGTILSLAVDSENQDMLLGGGGIRVHDVEQPSGIVRLHANGSLDSSFNATALVGQVRRIVLLPGGDILVIGSIVVMIDGQPQYEIARLHHDGSVDTTYKVGRARLGPNAQPILAATAQPDGKLLIGGWFNNIDGVPRDRVARLNQDGSIDSSFVPASFQECNNVFALLVQPDGKILVGAAYYRFAGVLHVGLARLNAEGTVDPNFHLEPRPYYATQLSLQPDGKIIVNGDKRLLADGTIDSTFFTGSGLGFSSGVSAQELLPDGSLLVGGDFDSFNGFPYANLVVLRTLPVLHDVHLNVHRNGAGQLQWLLSGPSGMNLVIEVSTDLQNWTPLISPLNGTGQIEFTDPAAGDHGHRFYRARAADFSP